ncbi:hypothetical protein PENTCL1PPCAC_5968, partial [Pristionchus entomophagus]
HNSTIYRTIEVEKRRDGFFSSSNNNRVRLDVGGVEHNTNALSEGGSGQVLVELSADGSSVSVRAGNTSPNAADSAGSGSGNVLLVVGLVDIHDALADVPLGVVLVEDTVELQDGGSLVLVALTAGETRKDGLDVESAVEGGVVLAGDDGGSFGHFTCEK